MTEKWERTFNDICDDENVSYRDNLRWNRLMPIVVQKWIAIKNLDDDECKRFAEWVRVRSNEMKMLYMNDTSLCAFCVKAEHESRTKDYGTNGATCAACVLNARCFDDSWVVKNIFVALLDGRFNDFRKLIERGINDVREMVVDD